jgi:RNA polymerase sigma factor (sigma-70 family)
MAADGFLAKAQSAASQDTSRTALEEFFDSLLAENGPALFRLAGGFTNTPADRDDLFQEIVLAIWQALPSFRGESSPRTYLFRIARNRAIAFLVSRRMPQAVDGEELLIRDPAPDPERRVEADQRRRTMLEAVRKLPFVYRDIITLALEGLSYTEMAELLGVSEANVGTRLSRARSELRKLLEKTI